MTTVETPVNASDIVLEGVCVNNLRNVDVRIKRGLLTVICGVSGSGKSSLAFDTLFAEGQRRYVETFSPSARQFLDQIERPNVSRIEGIPPAIAIRQNARTQSAHSTVGSRTEISDFLRAIFARCGNVHCEKCSVDAIDLSSDSAARLVLQRFEGHRGMLVVGSEGLTLDDWIADGYVRGIVGGRVVSLEEIDGDTDSTAPKIVTDRVRISADSLDRLAESIEQAFAASMGRCVLLVESDAGTVEIDGRNWAEFPLSRGVMCPTCGQQFETPSPERPDTLGPVRLSGHSLTTIAALEISDVIIWLNNVTESLTDELQQALSSPFHQLRNRLEFLTRVGIDYLSIDRPMQTLSGGEAQRVVLTAVLGSGLINTLYVLDEPTAGLHTSDSDKVIHAVRQLQQARNTVVVVEHDADFISAADEVIEVGPGAGADGGSIVFQGTPVDLQQTNTATASAFASRIADDPETVERREPTRWLEFSGLSCHNIQDLSGRIPLDVICAVTGVSGSGKSSLVVDGLFPAICKSFDEEWDEESDATIKSVTGCEDFVEVQLLDQHPLRQSRRSIPATVVGAFDEIRKAMAQTHEAKKRNYTPGMFSFNSAKGGRCPQCEGYGVVTIEMQFLADIRTTCEMCSGRRFRQDVLEVRYRDRSIHEILEMTAEEAFSFFNGNRKIQQRLNALRQAGLSYVRLGQPVATLSGGECQRLRIAAMLAGAPVTDDLRPTRRSHKTDSTRTLFILDEPSTGLHMQDIRALMTCLNHLVDIGHSVIVIEHDPNVLSHVDYIIEMGPGPGKQGGRIIASGAP